jgi:hypothetical protein
MSPVPYLQGNPRCGYWWGMKLPFTASPATILAIFFSEVLILHFLLIAIPRLRPKKTGWAIVQYIVIALAMVGLLGAIANVRQMVAQNLYEFSGPHVAFEFRDLLRVADDYSSPGMICMTFVRSDFSPPPEQFNQTQHEYDKACQWFKEIARLLPRKLPEGNAEIAWQTFPAVPNVNDQQLIGFVQRFRHKLDDYNQAANERRALAMEASRSDIDSLVIFLLPLSLSLALALQTTKTTYDTWVKPPE